MRTAFLRAALVLAIGLPAVLHAQTNAQRYISPKNGFSFALPSGYAAESSFEDQMEIVTLRPPSGNAGIMAAFIAQTPSSVQAAPLPFRDLVLAGGLTGCQGICAIAGMTMLESNPRLETMRYFIEQRTSLDASESPDTSHRLGPFYAIHIHPATNDLLLLTPSTPDAEGSLIALLPTIESTLAPPPTGSSASATSASTGSSSSLSASSRTPASASGGVVSSAPAPVPPAGSPATATPPPGGEEKLLFGIFSTELSRSQILALIGAFIFAILFILERVIRARREKREQQT